MSMRFLVVLVALVALVQFSQALSIGILSAISYFTF